jgi:hypothetical protein
MTTSRAEILYSFFNVSKALAIESVEANSSSTISRSDPRALGRAVRDWHWDGLRTVAMTLVFGVERYVATRPLPSPGRYN